VLLLLWFNNELSFFRCSPNYEDEYVFLMLLFVLFLLLSMNEPEDEDFLSPTGLEVNKVVNDDFGFAF
jgi:hypothetical protein